MKLALPNEHIQPTAVSGISLLPVLVMWCVLDRWARHFTQRLLLCLPFGSIL